MRNCAVKISRDDKWEVCKQLLSFCICYSIALLQYAQVRFTKNSITDST